MNLAHPFGVARGEVIVDRNDMNAAAGEAVEIGRQGRDERFTFTRSHLGDAALVQGDAADHLHVEMAHAGDAS